MQHNVHTASIRLFEVQTLQKYTFPTINGSHEWIHTDTNEVVASYMPDLENEKIITLHIYTRLLHLI